MKVASKSWGRRGRTKVALVGAMVLSVASVGLSAATSSASPSPIVVGGIFPYTGAKSLLSTWGDHGMNAGIYEVNHNGGVMGHMLVKKTVDDAADAVDALPAFRKLMISKPTFIIGPFSPTIEAIQNQFQPNHVVDFMVGGLTTLDNNSNPYLFRTSSSDSNEAIAMAYYAYSHGMTTASLIFDNSNNSQGFVAPLEAAFRALGGTIQQNITLTPGQSNYQSELETAMSGNPQVVFDSMDSQTAATLFTQARSLGYMNRTWIGDDLQSAPQGSYAQSFGPTAPKYLVAALPSTPAGAAYNHYLSDYYAANGKSSKLYPTGFNEYDSIVIASLAMTLAKSTNPDVWVKDVTMVSNPPGTICGTYASCVALIKAGKKINYDGAAGNDNFNQFHNVFSGFQMVGFDAKLNNVTRAYVGPASLAYVVAKEAAQG